MGIYERDYERGYGQGGWSPDGGGGIQLRWPRTVVGWVLLTTIAAYVVELMFNETAVMTPSGAFTPNKFVDFFKLDSDWYLRPWRAFGLLTYGFVHANDNLAHILFNMFGVWLFGRELERRLSSREFLFFYLAAILAGGLAFTLGQAISGGVASALGASAGTVAVTILFAIYYPHQRILFMMVIPMPMWMLGVFMVGMDVFGAVGRPGAGVAFAAHLGGAAFAAAYNHFGWRLSRWAPTELELPSFKRRPKLRVHHVDEDDEPQDQEVVLENELDRVLSKIQTQGQDSLTRKERQILERASRRAQQRRR